MSEEDDLIQTFREWDKRRAGDINFDDVTEIKTRIQDGIAS